MKFNPLNLMKRMMLGVMLIAAGAIVTRLTWAKGYALRLGLKGNRGKAEPCFMQSGSRSGEIVWIVL